MILMFGYVFFFLKENCGIYEYVIIPDNEKLQVLIQQLINNESSSTSHKHRLSILHPNEPAPWADGTGQSHQEDS